MILERRFKVKETDKHISLLGYCKKSVDIPSFGPSKSSPCFNIHNEEILQSRYKVKIL